MSFTFHDKVSCVAVKLLLGIALVLGLAYEMYADLSPYLAKKAVLGPNQPQLELPIGAYCACRLALALAGVVSGALGAGSAPAAALCGIAGVALIVVPLGLLNYLSLLQYASHVMDFPLLGRNSLQSFRKVRMKLNGLCAP